MDFTIRLAKGQVLRPSIPTKGAAVYGGRSVPVVFVPVRKLKSVLVKNQYVDRWEVSVNGVKGTARIC
jgi:hypothetical protein